VSIRGHSVAVIPHGANRSSLRFGRSCDEPRKARVSPEGLKWRWLPANARRCSGGPRRTRWTPESPVSIRRYSLAVSAHGGEPKFSDAQFAKR